MPFKPTVEVSGEPGTYHQNGLTFNTREEAIEWAHGLAMRWFLVTNWSAIEVTEPANYALVEGCLIDLTVTPNA